MLLSLKISGIFLLLLPHLLISHSFFTNRKLSFHRRLAKSKGIIKNALEPILILLDTNSLPHKNAMEDTRSTPGDSCDLDVLWNV